MSKTIKISYTELTSKIDEYPSQFARNVVNSPILDVNSVYDILIVLLIIHLH